MKTPYYFLLFVCGLFLIVVSPQLFSDGMFMDGVYYATIARNWAVGLGSFWEPYFTEHVGNPFFDHPPLAFFLEGTLFYLLGDHIWIERLYSFLTYVFTAWVMFLLWKSITIRKYSSLFWFPLLIWLFIPKVIWSVSNNLLENTLMIFTCLSILFGIRFLKSHNYLNIIVSGFFIFLGFLTKGFVAFFPLSFFFFYFLFRKNFKLIQLLKVGISHLLSVTWPFLGLWLFYPKGIESIQQYFHIQVYNSLQNVVTVEHRGEILTSFFQEAILPLSILTFLLTINHLKFRLTIFKHIDKSLHWTLLAVVLSGILPIMISLKQSTFYINPVFPLFALVLGSIGTPVLYQLINKIQFQSSSFKVFKVFSLLLFICSIAANIYFSQTVGRNKKRIQDIKTIVSEIEPSKALFISFEIYREWSLYAYFHRYGFVSLDAENPDQYQYMIKQKGNQEYLPEGYRIWRNDLNEIDLYIRE